MKQTKQSLYSIILFLSFFQAAEAQDNLNHAGIMYTAGTQQAFPFNSKDYTYDLWGVKALLNHTMGKPGRISYEIQVEPGINRATHQLLNEYFVQPDYGSDYLALREEYTQVKTITEYVVNVGFQVRLSVSSRLSFFVIGSIGPMYSDTETERLAKGLAFSDIIAIGAGYRAGKMLAEIRPGLRHVSNADLKFPNCGHNSTNIDFSLAFCW